MTEILLVASLTLLASFLCSLFEAALYSVRPSQIEVLKERGAPGADRLARLRDDIEAPVAAILTVNTAAHTVGASWCGAMVAVEFGNYAIGAFAALFTVLVLAVTEIVPKSLGVRFAATLAPRIVWPLQIMIWSVWPVVWLARCSMRLITRRGEFTGPSEEELIVSLQDWLRRTEPSGPRSAAGSRTPCVSTSSRRPICGRHGPWSRGFRPGHAWPNSARWRPDGRTVESPSPLMTTLTKSSESRTDARSSTRRSPTSGL